MGNHPDGVVEALRKRLPIYPKGEPPVALIHPYDIAWKASVGCRLWALVGCWLWARQRRER